MQIGYARVSIDAQDLTTQREQLAAAGCQRIKAACDEARAGVLMDAAA